MTSSDESVAKPYMETYTTNSRPMIRRRLRICCSTFNMCCYEPFPPEVLNDPNLLFVTAKSLLDNFIVQGCDLYVIGFQEIYGLGILNAITSLTGCIYMKIEDSSDRIYGRGDGSMVYGKATLLAVFISPRIASDVVFKVSRGIQFGLLTDGFKGSVAILLEILGQNVLFINSHFSSSSEEERLSHYRSSVSNLGLEIGGYPDITALFNHIIWFGDFNSRVSGIEVADVMDCLYQSKEMEIFQRGDELRRNMNLGKWFNGFSEAPLSFLPTYKKRIGQKIVSADRNRNQIDTYYQVSYAGPWWKAGASQLRLPSWCDRILYRNVNKSNACLKLAEDINETIYKSDSTHLVGSDHSPVRCLFDFEGIYFELRPRFRIALSRFRYILQGVGSSVLTLTSKKSENFINEVVKKSFIHIPLIAGDSLGLQPLPVWTSTALDTKKPLSVNVRFPALYELRSTTNGVASLINATVFPGNPETVVSWEYPPLPSTAIELGDANHRNLYGMHIILLVTDDNGTTSHGRIALNEYPKCSYLYDTSISLFMTNGELLSTRMAFSLLIDIL